jgi:glycosyltransferase involved in cell wall biosynthesis
MYVGNAYPYKNLWSLIEAFRDLNMPDLKLILAGKKEYFYQDLESRTEKAGIKNVIFTGFVSDRELAWLFAHTKLYIFPSLAEGFGLPGLEAMQFDAPVISSNASCLPEVYQDAVVYFDPKKNGDLASKIRETINNEPAKSELIKAGRRLIKSYSWERMARETLDIYKQA